MPHRSAGGHWKWWFSKGEGRTRLLVYVTLCTVAAGILWGYSSRIDANHAQLIHNQLLQRGNAIAGARTAIELCRDYRSKFTADVRDQELHLRRNLKVVGIPVTPRLLRISHRTFERQRRRFDPRKCRELANVKRVNKLYHTHIGGEK